MGRISLILLLLTSGIMVKGQTADSTFSFTLEEARAYAIENNKNIENAEIDIEIAKKQVWETTAIGLPQVNGYASYQYIPGDIPEFSFASDPNSLFGQLINGAFRAGWIDTTMLPEDEGGQSIAVKNSITYGVNVNQLIFSGEYIVGLQASKTFRQLSEHGLEDQILTVKENISNSYFTILSLQNNHDILQASLKNLKSSLREMQAMYEQGFVEETEVSQFKINVANVENALTSIENQIEISKKLFKIQMGMEVEDKVILTESLDDILFKLVPEKMEAGEFNVEENVTYKTLETQVELNELSVKREQSKYLPSLSANYSYTDRTNEPDFDFTIKHTIGVSLNVPIFSSGSRRSKVQQAVLELQKSRNNKENLRKSLLMQVEQARFNYESALRQYKNEKNNLDLSKMILDRTSVKYKEGLASSFDLTQAQNQFLDSSSNYTTAIIEMLSAKIALNKILNNL